ncbi:MAG: PadR family transcriptional regulator [Acidobacteriia bacterium]|nr:PadR family transcriptional regulator [Terriglobia bacterium]
MKAQKISRLGYALLGLLRQRPSSGYDLRKIFSSTAMKTYSDSPGAVYPALRRLEQQGLIRGSLEHGSGLRRRQIFHHTPKGLAELKKWIVRPITQDDLARRDLEVLLRFAFSEEVVGPVASVQLLKSLQAELVVHLAVLSEQLAAARSKMSISGRLAFECGLRGCESWLEWTRYAIATYEKQEKGGKS